MSKLTKFNDIAIANPASVKGGFAATPPCFNGSYASASASGHSYASASASASVSSGNSGYYCAPSRPQFNYCAPKISFGCGW